MKFHTPVFPDIYRIHSSFHPPHLATGNTSQVTLPVFYNNNGHGHCGHSLDIRVRERGGLALVPLDPLCQVEEAPASRQMEP